jgi:hypothetical protein
VEAAEAFTRFYVESHGVCRRNENARIDFLTSACPHSASICIESTELLGFLGTTLLRVCVVLWVRNRIASPSAFADQMNVGAAENRGI